MLKAAAICLVLAAIPMGVFAYWGLMTKAGQRRFDEMDAYYPALAGLGGVILLLIAAALWGLSWWLTRDR
jgi:uncharacterized BrkB/YihY/UPF0761 family membrane protein